MPPEHAERKPPTTASQAPLRGQADYLARVRALYEGSAVPVHEVARLAGVSARMIYLYARRDGWTPRALGLEAARCAGAWPIADAASLDAVQARAAEMQSERAADRDVRRLEMLAGALTEVLTLRFAPRSGHGNSEQANACSKRAADLTNRLASAIIGQMGLPLLRD